MALKIDERGIHVKAGWESYSPESLKPGDVECVDDLVKKISKMTPEKLKEKTNECYRFFRRGLETRRAILEMDEIILGKGKLTNPINVFEDELTLKLYSLQLLCAEMDKRGYDGKVLYFGAVEELFYYRVKEAERIDKESVKT